MRANHRCAVVIRQVRGACGRAARSPRLCGRCAVVRSAFSETDAYSLAAAHSQHHALLARKRLLVKCGNA